VRKKWQSFLAQAELPLAYNISFKQQIFHSESCAEQKLFNIYDVALLVKCLFCQPSVVYSRILTGF